MFQLGNATGGTSAASGGMNFGSGTGTPGGFSFGSAGSSGNAGGQQPTGGAPAGGLFGANQQQPFGSANNSTGTSLFGNSSGNNGASSGGGLFGNNTNTVGTGTVNGFGQNNKIGTGGGLFGAKPATGGGLFGAQQTNSPASGGLFGNNNQNAGNTNGGLFGNNSANRTGTTDGLFGNNQPLGSTGSGGLFGGNMNSNNANQTSGNTSNSLFGNVNNNNANTNTNSTTGVGGGGGGLFGSTNNNNANTSTTATGGGLFGSNNNANSSTNSSGGLFGNNNNTSNAQNPTTSGGLFGGVNNTNNTGATSSGGLFGQKPAGTTSSLGGGGLFGNNNTQSNTGGGLFGNKTLGAGTGLGTGGGLFGNNNNTQTSLFGQQQNQQNQQTQQNPGVLQSGINSSQPSFSWSKPSNGGSSNPTLNSGQFGNQSMPQQSSLFTSQPQYLAHQQQHQQQLSNYPLQVQEQILKCKESWDPTSIRSKLKSFVYNKVNETDAMLYNKPLEINQEEWDNALEQKPSNDVIPVQILGFDGLNQRNQLQRENVAQIRTILQQMMEKSHQMRVKHELDTTSRILKAKSRNSEIERRILRLASQITMLKSRGLPLSINEEKLWQQFQELLDRSKDPAGLGKTNELWARLAILKDSAKNLSEHLDNVLVIVGDNGGIMGPESDKSIITSNGNENKINDEDSNGKIDKIAEILSNQQNGITFLNETLEKDHHIVDQLVKN